MGLKCDLVIEKIPIPGMVIFRLTNFEIVNELFILKARSHALFE